MKVFLHIGLPKTATTYLHKYVFPKFDESEIIYNPAEIMEDIHDIYYRGIDEDRTEEFIKKIKSKLEKYKNKKILISDQNLSVDNYDLNFKKHIGLLKEIFPHATVLIMLRFQPDWCLSMYKQSIHQCCIQDISEFLNYDGSEFLYESKPNENINKPKTNVVNLDYYELLKTYFNAFDKRNVSITFYEDFRKNNESFINDLCLKLGVTNKTETYKVHYKGLSALSIKILVFIHVFFTKLHIQIPYSFKSNSVLAKTSYKNLVDEAKNNNKKYLIPTIFLGKIYFRFRSYLTWISLRNFMQNYFDKIIYVNWDMLEKNSIRNLLTDAAHENNIKLLEYFKEAEIPKSYLK